MLVTHRAPSNIALIKYRGKHSQQLPNNPSISFSLANAYTDTHITTVSRAGEESDISFSFEGQNKPSFIPKIRNILNQAIAIYPQLAEYDYQIESKNSFPHSAGIASSASSMAALAYGLCEIAGVDVTSSQGLQEISHLARLGSGSACRSVYPWSSRGEFPGGGSDLYATPLTDIHPDFHHIRNTIILVDDTTKSISSTQGHACMDTNPYATQRYENARTRHTQLLNTLHHGGRSVFTQIVEAEALDLHAMMMTSQEYFTLLQPQTLALIHALRNRRKQTDDPFAFTIDAGPNIHLLYPPASRQTIEQFLTKHKKNYISCLHDHVISP